MIDNSVLEGKRIVIVDDSAENIYTLRTLLRVSGAEIIVAWWSKGDIQKLAEQLPIDLILLDLQLPGGRSGFEIFDEIRAMPDFDTVPIVAVSAKDPAIALPETQQRGFNGFIGKPFDPSMFPQHLGTVLQGQDVWITRD